MVKEVNVFQVQHEERFLPEVVSALAKLGTLSGKRVAIEDVNYAEFWSKLAAYCQEKGAEVVDLTHPLTNRNMDAEFDNLFRLRIEGFEIPKLRLALFYARNPEVERKLSREGINKGEKQKLLKAKEAYQKICREHLKNLSAREIEVALHERITALRELVPKNDLFTFPKRELIWAKIIKKKNPDIIICGSGHFDAISKAVKEMGNTPVVAYRVRPSPRHDRHSRRARRKAYYFRNGCWNREPFGSRAKKIRPR